MNLKISKLVFWVQTERFMVILFKSFTQQQNVCVELLDNILLFCWLHERLSETIPK